MDWEWTKEHWWQNKEEVEKMREDGQKKRLESEEWR